MKYILIASLLLTPVISNASNISAEGACRTLGEISQQIFIAHKGGLSARKVTEILISSNTGDTIIMSPAEAEQVLPPLVDAIFRIPLNEQASRVYATGYLMCIDGLKRG